MAVDNKPGIATNVARRRARTTGADTTAKPRTTGQTTGKGTRAAETEAKGGTYSASATPTIARDEVVAPSVSTPPRAVLLAALLAAEGSSIASARKGLVRALSTELLMPTSAAAEEKAAALFAALRGGQPVDVDVAVREALARGPQAAAELVAAFSWRVGAAAADQAPAALVEQAAALGEALTHAGVRALAAHAPTSTPDAVATMVAQSALLSGGQTTDSAYYAPADFSYSHHFDAFTNERNLPDAIAKLPASGGAMVGVSGGALQTAAQIRADAAVITDLNPEIRDFVLVFATALRVLVDKLDATGGGPPELLQLMNENLLGPQRGNPAFLEELRTAGLPEPLLARVPTMMAGLYNESGMNMQQVWLMPKLDKSPLQEAPPWMAGWSSHGTVGRIGAAAGGTPEQIEAQVRAIAKLVGQGSLVAAVVDLSDADGPRRVASFLDAKECAVQALHLSNALDYVVDPRGVLDGLTRLPIDAAATVLSSCAGMPVDRRIGNFYEPGVNGWKTWMEPGGIKDRLRIQQANFHNLCLEAFVTPPRPGPSNETLRDPVATRAALQGAIEAHYRDPQLAMSSLQRALLSALEAKPPARDSAAYRPWCDRAMALRQELPTRLEQLGIAPPKGPDEVRSLVRSLRPLFD